jgi:hypothetical protein
MKFTSRIILGALLSCTGLYCLSLCYHNVYRSGHLIARVKLGSGSLTEPVDLRPEMNPVRPLLSLRYTPFRKAVPNQTQQLLAWQIGLRDATDHTLWSEYGTVSKPSQENDQNLRERGTSQSLPDFEIRSAGPFRFTSEFTEQDARLNSAELELRGNVSPLNYSVLAVGCGLFAIGMGTLFFRGSNSE